MKLQRRQYAVLQCSPCFIIFHVLLTKRVAKVFVHDSRKKCVLLCIYAPWVFMRWWSFSVLKNFLKPSSPVQSVEYWIHCSSLWLQLSCINSDFELGHASTTVEVHQSVQTTSQCNDHNRPRVTTVHEIFKSGLYWLNMYISHYMISLRSNWLHLLRLRKWSMKLLLFTRSDGVDLIIYFTHNETTVICLFKSLLVETQCLSVPVKFVRCRRTMFTEGETH